MAIQPSAQVLRHPSVYRVILVICIPIFLCSFSLNTMEAVSRFNDLVMKKASITSSYYISEQPWKGKPPRWCAALIRRPRERPRRGSSEEKSCKRDRFGALCQDGSPRFFSQYNQVCLFIRTFLLMRALYLMPFNRTNMERRFSGIDNAIIQDIWLWNNHWKRLRRRGTYVDIAANEPVQISNTYFYDKCLQWKGLCVEANEQYQDRLLQMRSCGIIATCVSNKRENVTFVMEAGSGGVESTNKNQGLRQTSPRMPLTCIPTQEAIEASGINIVDMISLDVEGHELEVLKGIDWTKTKINVIVIESVKKETRSMLHELGYRLAPMPHTVKEKAKPGNLISDFVFLHRDVVWGKPV